MHYQISFFNDLTDSTGHVHHVCQRKVDVSDADDEQSAIVRAVDEFQRLEVVAHWGMRAQMIECRRLADSNGAAHQQSLPETDSAAERSSQNR